jgi:acetyl esterase
MFIIPTTAEGQCSEVFARDVTGIWLPSWGKIGIIPNPRFSSLLLPLSMLVLPMIGSAKSYDNVEFSHPGNYSLQFDASVPDGNGPFAAVIIVHGGAWVSGDRRRSVEPLFEPLSRAGFAWFSISYRLANGGDPSGIPNSLDSLISLGAAVDDVRDAIKYVKKHAAEYHVDPNRLALVGESAGAQLASMAALKGTPESSVEAVVAFYSPSDLVKLLETNPRIPVSIRQALSESVFGEVLFSSLRNLSPVTWASKDSPPFLLIHGTQDTLVPFEQSKEMCDALRMAGSVCEIYPVEGAGHGLRFWESEPDLTAYKRYMTSWLDRKLRPIKTN